MRELFRPIERRPSASGQRRPDLGGRPPVWRGGPSCTCQTRLPKHTSWQTTWTVYSKHGVTNPPSTDRIAHASNGRDLQVFVGGDGAVIDELLFDA